MLHFPAAGAFRFGWMRVPCCCDADVVAAIEIVTSVVVKILLLHKPLPMKIHAAASYSIKKRIDL